MKHTTTSEYAIDIDQEVNERHGYESADTSLTDDAVGVTMGIALYSRKSNHAQDASAMLYIIINS